MNVDIIRSLRVNIKKIIALSVIPSVLLSPGGLTGKDLVRSDTAASVMLAPHIVIDSAAAQDTMQRLFEARRVQSEPPVRKPEKNAVAKKKNRAVSGKLVTKKKVRAVRSMLEECRKFILAKKTFMDTTSWEKEWNELRHRLDAIELFSSDPEGRFESIENESDALRNKVKKSGQLQLFLRFWKGSSPRRSNRSLKPRIESPEPRPAMLQRVVDWLGKRGSIVWNRIQGREESVPGITGISPESAENTADLPVTVTETAAPGPYEWNDDPEGTEDTGDKDPELISKPPISLNQEQQMSLLRRLNRLREDIEANINNLSGEIIEALLEDIFTLEDEIITGTIKVGDGKSRIEDLRNAAQTVADSPVDEEQPQPLSEEKEPPRQTQPVSKRAAISTGKKEAVRDDLLVEAVSLSDPQRQTLRRVDKVIADLSGQIGLLREIIAVKHEDIALIDVRDIHVRPRELILEIGDRSIISLLRSESRNVGVKLKSDCWLELRVVSVLNGTKVVVFSDNTPLEHIDFQGAQFFGVANTFSEERQKNALEAVRNAIELTGSSGVDILDYVLGLKRIPRDVSRDDLQQHCAGLDEFQSAAVNMIVKSRFGLIHGPFGSGKTRTVKEGIRKLILEEKKPVLALTQQHSNADDITLALGADERIPVLRFGNVPQRYEEEVRQRFARQNSNARYVFDKNFNQLNTVSDGSGRENGHGCLLTATLLGGSFDRILGDILAYKKKNTLEGLVVVVDEAGLINYPELVTALFLLQPDSLMLMGDHVQFSPYKLSGRLNRKEMIRISRSVRINKKVMWRYDASIFAELMRRSVNRVSLLKNYRNHWLFVELGRLFYSVKLHSASRERRDPVSADTLEIIDTSGNEQAYEHWDRNEEMFYNVAEAEWIVKKAKEFLEKKDNSGRYYQPEDITIVTPYNGQIEYIRQVIDSDFELSLMPDVQARLKKNIITSRQVQGRENRIVLVSFVRSRPGARPQENYHQRYTGLNELPIVADPALLLVSLTRAVEKMAIIGNRETLDQISSDIYGKVFNFIRNRSNEKSVDTPAALPSGDFPDAVLSLAIDQSV